jgi:hypothetical protein
MTSTTGARFKGVEEAGLIMCDAGTLVIVKRGNVPQKPRNTSQASAVI